MNKYYFFAKVDTGNRLLDAAESWGGFYIGFKDTPIRAFPQTTSHAIKLNYPDLEFLSMFSAKGIRDSVVVVTYSPTDLIFWSISDDLCLLKDCVNADRWKIKEDLKARGIKEHDSDFDKLKFLPTKLIYSIKRDYLISPINSLSVYQYLNQGTFRPFFRLAPDKDRLMPDELKSPDFYPNWDPVEILALKNSKQERVTLEETQYGKFIRIYFDAILKAKDHTTFKKHLKETFRSLSDKTKKQLILSILNPSQFETLAALLLLDFGFTLDVGKGNALDVIDLRGRVSHKSHDAGTAIIMKFLDYVKANQLVSITSALRTHMLETKTLSIQCKASNKPKQQSDSFMTFQPSNQQDERNVLPIETLVSLLYRDRSRFPMSYDWVSMLSNQLFDA